MAQIRLIGTDPSQVPTNGMLGNLAFQNAESVSLEKLVVTSTVGINGNVTTSSGSAISYGGGETYQIWNDDPESSAVDTNGQPAAFRTLKTFVASKSGSLKFKFSAYIQSGTYYWAWRIINQASTVLSSGHYNGGLDAGQISSVHEYRRFVASVSNVTPGDILTLQMVSANSSGTPLTGNATGQILYAKEFRAYSTTPSIDHGGSSNVWGKNVGIGVHIPGSYNLPLPPITRLDVRGPNVANNVASLGSVPPATMYVGSSSGWGQNDGGSIALGGAADNSQFTATYAGIAGRRESVHGWEYGGYLTLSTVTIGTDQLSERVRIRADGMFEVKGAGVAGTSPALSVSGSAPANSLVLDSSGRVGLGTSATAAYGGQLAIAINGAGDFIVLADNTTTSGAAAPRLGCLGNDLVFKTNSGSAAATGRLTINSAGLTTCLKGVQAPMGWYYQNTYTCDSTWGTAWQTVIPNGTTSFGTYVVTFYWDYAGAPGSGQPYYLMAATLFTGVPSTNGSGVENEVALLSSTHTGATGAYIRVRTANSPMGTTSLQVNLVNFSVVSGTQFTVYVQRIGY